MSQAASVHEISRPLVALILTSAAIMGSPGPSTISATAMGAAFGLRRSLAYVGGLILGTIGVLLAVSIGIVALVFSMPHAARVLNAASAIYILYLAFRIATEKPERRRRGPGFDRRPVAGDRQSESLSGDRRRVRRRDPLRRRPLCRRRR
jgi:threonine/homoserine/homoserine lactone efflux protein